MVNSTALYETLLNLPTLQVDSVELSERKILVHCHTNSGSEICPVCKCKTSKINQYTTHLIRDLNLADREVSLQLKVKQYECEDCGRYFTETPSFADLGKSYTHRLAKFIFDLSCQQCYTRVGAILNIHAKTVERIVLTYCKQVIDLSARYRKVRRLGIDELSNKKGKKDFICVLTNLDTGEHLDLLPDRKKSTLIAHFEALGSQFCSQLSDVSCDMWRPYIQVIQQYFPQANIIIDRFHTTQAINECVDKLRKTLRKKEPKQEAYKPLKWILYKQYHTLNDTQLDYLEEGFQASAQLKEVYWLREQFHHILDNSTTLQVANKNLDKWIDKVELCQKDVFQPFLKTLKSKKEYILNYVKDHLSNAATEGLNNLIRQIKRASWGMPKFENLRLRVLAFNL